MFSNSNRRICQCSRIVAVLILSLAFVNIGYATSSMTCDNSNSEECLANTSTNTQRLSPSDLPLPKLFDDFEPPVNVSLSKHSDTPTTTITALPGSIRQQGKHLDSSTDISKFLVLPEFLPSTVVTQLLTLLRGHEDATIANGHTTIALDQDPDSVDGMTSQEIFLDNDALRRGETSKSDPKEDMEGRRDLRAQMKELTDPYLQNVLVPFLQEWYGKERCGRPGRVCTPCYSLIRRYRAGERQSHAPHYDSHSFVTVVVSLVDYGREYQGGLYVSTKTSEKDFVRLNRGDAVVHQGDLHHGVKVLDTRDDGMPSERWSWILWFRDSDTCDDHSVEWYHQGAMEGNPTCMYMRATKESTSERVVEWNTKASDAGHAQASVKLAHAYLKKLPSNLSYDRMSAKALFQSAIDSSNEPDGHYGLASLYLEEMKQTILPQPHREGAKWVLRPGEKLSETQRQTAIETFTSPKMSQAIHHLEEAARGGHFFAMFNLGICSTYGYGQKDGALRDFELAIQWFEASGLPEGFFAKSLYLQQTGNTGQAEEYRRKASALGFGSPWRRPAREQTGSGGSSGAKLNLHWPPLPTGEMPPGW